MAEGINDLTGVISSARDASDMLWWCAQVFEHELSTRDGDGSRQGFAFVSFAQASANLVGWVCAEQVNFNESRLAERSQMFHMLMEEVVWSRELRAIAEAARHAKRSSSYWPGRNIPILRGEPDRLEELDAQAGQKGWFQNMMWGLTDGSLWFENRLTGSGVEADARTVILEHCSAWDEKLHVERFW